MEIKEVDRVVIAKPVASRPTSSSFGSFSELLAGVIDASETPANNSSSEMALSAIRPKTVKVKPAMYVASHNRNPDQAETSGAVPCSSENVAHCQNQSTIVFKPLAKIVSKATVSFLATMGNTNIDHQQVQFQTDACAQPTDQEKCHLTSNQQLSSIPQVELSPGIGHQMLEKEQKVSAPSLVNPDQLSSDGYNWRKYGQKQVKGSEYPRSYYKCTHPNCPVKKKVERSLDGQIAEIVYRGEHNHIKPHPLKRSYSGVQGQGLADDAAVQDYHSPTPMLGDNVCERNETTEGKKGHQNDATISKQTTFPGKSSMLCKNPVDTRNHSAASTIREDSAIFSVEYGGAKVLEAANNEPKIKRRKHDKNNEAEASDEGVQEQRVWVQNNTEPEVMGDGFRWRKYGQKVVKGNPHPRSYYRCTNLKCNVRKHVERALDDPTAFITTYEGRHNHEKPMKNANHGSASEPDIRTPNTTEKES